MATEILAIGSTAGANSADVVVAAGEQLTVCLKGPLLPGVVTILLKDDGGDYWPVGSLGEGRAAAVIAAAGTYRFTRVSGSVGVFSG